MKFFDINSPLNKLLTNIADLMLVNFLFILFSLPIVTFGASLTAMNHVTLQMSEGKQLSIFKSFFESFKENFKQATGLWAIVFGMNAVFFAWYIVIENMIDTNIASILRAFLYVFIVIFSMILIYLFYLQAKFENTIGETIKNAFLMSIRHLFTTLLSLVIIGGTVIAIMFYPRVTGYGLLLVLGGFSLVSYGISFLMKRVFRHYIQT
ncbi:YesL family protein [Jeotgalibaca ciconiae]|nr:YesL family protein [Jeotgalibaca ciconiae]HJB24778.1 DUF624 domain-containing protein [Candidatus Jeotgalibaca pullicola]